MKKSDASRPGNGVPETFSVQGQISWSNHRPVANALVRAYDKDLRRETELGKATTDAAGHYEIQYTAAQLGHAGKSGADLIVRVLDREGKVLAASPVIFSAESEATVDLTLEGAAPTDLSEYERLVNDLTPMLQGVRLVDLTEDDIRFLTSATGNNALHIVYLVLAARRAVKIKIPPEAFYGFFRQNLPTRPGALLLQEPAVLRLALETSVQQNIIPAAIGAQIDSILTLLDQPAHLLQLDEQDQIPALRLLGTTTLPQDQQVKFLNLFARSDETTESFWQTLRSQFSETQVKELQLTLQLGLLTQNHVPLVRALQKRQGGPPITSLRDLAAIPEADWLAMVRRPEVGVPDGVPGENEAARSQNYVSGIVQMVEAAFPTATIAAKLAQENRPENGEVIRFLSAHPDFDFETTRINDYLDNHAESTSKDVSDSAELAGQLRAMQRVYAVTPRYEDIQALLSEGLDSASAIATLSPEAFVEQFAEKLGGEAPAKVLYAKARQISETSAVIMTTVHQGVNDVLPWVVARPPDTIKKMPNYSTLFGSFSLCDCGHCESVYSPAAYLVDLLQFLSPKSGEKPIEVLRQRRPDLEHIQLSCENTEIALPYIDLVNEILEYYVAHHGQLQAGLAQDTVDIFADELSVNPQYRNDHAYELLQEAVFPPGLPFDRSLELARAYLEHLGSSRYEVMQTFQKNGTPPADAIAGEYLKLSPRERDILTGNTTNELSEFYGYDPNDPASHDQWQSDLAQVPHFLTRIGITFADLTELLKTRFLNANHSLQVTADDPSLCDLNEMTIEPLDDQVLGRLHRLIRLWRTLGWTIQELDQAIFALQSDDITATLLQTLAEVKQLETDLKLPLDSLLSLWSTIQTTGDNPLYIRLFLSKAMLNLGDGAFTLDHSDPPQIVGDGQSDLTLAAHVPALLAALRLSAADLDLIRVDAMLADAATPLNLANLSALYRYAILAKALRLKVADLIGLKALSGVNPFESPHQSREFVKVVRQVQQSGFSFAQLNYLYRHLIVPPGTLAPQPAHLLILAKTLRDGLTQIAADNTLVDEDPLGELTRSRLASLFENAIVDQVIQMVNGSLVYGAPLDSLPASIVFPPISVTNKASYNISARRLQFTGPMTTNEEGELLNASADPDYQAAVRSVFQQPREFIADVLTGFLNPADAVTQLLETSSLNADGTPDAVVIAQKFHYILEQLLPYLRDQLSRSLVKQTLAGEFRLDGDMIELLLETPALLPSRANPQQAAIQDFLALRSPGLTGNYFNTPDLTGTPTAQIDALLAFDGQGITTVIPASASSARWNSMLLAPNNDNYTLSIRVNGGVRLWVGDDAQPVIDVPHNASLAELSSAPMALKASQIYTLQLEVTQLGGPAVVEMRWRGATLPKNFIPSANLYPVSVFNTFTAAFTLLQKIAMLVNGFTLNTREVAYLSSHAVDFDDLSLAGLPLEPSVEVDQHAPAYFKQWQRLNDFAALRDQIRQSNASLIEVFEAVAPGDPMPTLLPGSTGAAVIALQRLLNAAGAQPVLNEDGVFDVQTRTAVITFQQSHDLNPDALVGPATWDALRATTPTLWDEVTAKTLKESSLVDVFGWDARTLDVLITNFGLGMADFNNEMALVRLQTCIQLINRLGISAEHLFDWASPVLDTDQANEIAKTVKAKYDDETWLTIGKALNDGLRERQRDALLAYVLNKANIVKEGVTDSNQLFEYFLIDVDMSACMFTSRIKQAISSVQLFIQRCLMNLEKGVKPSAINEDYWEWMRNYRVWEANRKVFLYPENWIEPELRDDKSPFFEELENQLLQNDMTADAAEQALLDYLEKLDEVARLEICGMCHQHETVDEMTTIDVVHVFGRTFNTPPTYYYRQLVSGTTWTAWEKVNLDIQGNHLIPVIYNRRLHVFWLSFEQKSDKNQNVGHPLIESRTHWEWQHKHDEWDKQDHLWKTLNSIYQALKNQDQTFHTHTATEFVNGYNKPSEGHEPLDLEHQILPEFNPHEEPAEPSEPQTTSQPTLTHWEIKLAWSEYWQDKWSPKQTTSEFIRSPHVTKTLQQVEADYWGQTSPVRRAPEDAEHRYVRYVDYPARDRQTIVELYLPEEETHFLRAKTESGELSLDLYRRYHHEFEILGDFLPVGTEMESYDYLGHFQVTDCGAKVRAVSSFDARPKQFNALGLPDGTENSFMRVDYGAGKRHLRLTGPEKSLNVLKTIPDSSGDYDLLDAPDRSGFSPTTPFGRFFYQDKRRTYYVHPWVPDSRPALRDPAAAAPAFSPAVDDSLVSKFKEPQPVEVIPDAKELESIDFLRWSVRSYLKFDNFFHPFVCDFIQALNQKGIPGLMARSDQSLDNDTHTGQDHQQIQTVFDTRYDPAPVVYAGYPRENVTFDADGAYALYNWELFFHIPMLIATRLSQNQQFEDAQTWFHYIFNPATNSERAAPRRYWNTQPFFLNTHPENDQIQALLTALDSRDEGMRDVREQVIAQIKAWRDNPFNPHLLARMRMTAYQKNVVMKYIDNLIAWGDQLFSQDTLETINEATLLYVLAYNILGPRPEVIPPAEKPEPLTYYDLKKDHIDKFSNVLVSFENEIATGFSPLAFSLKREADSSAGSAGTQSITSAAGRFYFCIPQNDNLLAYWDTVADRLFKIRNCMNIEGLVRELPLFEPPIDPSLLVRATAMGLDLSSVLSDINSPQPYYRFSYVLQRALELCSEVKTLGAALLSALEKKDAETLAALRASHETSILKAVQDVKEQQILEATAALDGLHKAKEAAQIRHQYYSSRDFMSPAEIVTMALKGSAGLAQIIGQAAKLESVELALLPGIFVGEAGAMGSPLQFQNIWSGQGAAYSSASFGDVALVISSELSIFADMSGTLAGYQRRKDDWDFQAQSAAKELEQIDKQIAAAEIRLAISEKELENHKKQIDNSAAVEEFLREMYTNEELYNWMFSQISAVFFQAYKQAYDLAKRAEKAFRFERGLTISNFIQFGYWDNLRKGLLSGERLFLDLKRMEQAYLDQNKREYEITKHVSLLFQDPMALITLKETGQCEIELPEALFDADYPGHYMRRLKSVSLTVPCIVGPYTSINCTLTLLKNRVRVSNVAQGDYVESEDGDDSRFLANFAAMQSIATSHAQNDSGVFELNFRDERYLPFEGAGAISRWRIELPRDTNAFDFNTLSDAILHLKYTARDGGEALSHAARKAWQDMIEGGAVLSRLFSAKHEFPNDWYRFLHPTNDTDPTSLSLDLARERFPFPVRRQSMQINTVRLFLSFKDTIGYPEGIGPLTLELTPPTGSPIEEALQSDKSVLNGLPQAVLDTSGQSQGFGMWSLTAPQADIERVANLLQDIIIICQYSVTP